MEGQGIGTRVQFFFCQGQLGVLKDDFCDMLAEFHKGGRINKEHEATFLTLIPKAKIPYL